MFKLHFFTSLRNYLSKSWNYTNLFIWIGGPWTPWRSLVPSLGCRQSSVGSV